MLEFLGPCFLPPANYFFNRSGWDSYRGALTSAGVFRYPTRPHAPRVRWGKRPCHIYTAGMEGRRPCYVYTYVLM